MIPKEIFKQVRHIEIRTNRVVNELFAGRYESVFKGRGIEFAEVREYFPGDDIRTIDWNVTARHGHPYVKRYVEERELAVMLLVDASGSGSFGSVDKFKREVACELGAVLAFSAIKNNDRVGLLIFTDTVEKFIPPKKGRRHVLRLMREILYFKPKQVKTDLVCALDYIGRALKKRCVVFLISDFITKGYEKELSLINKRHDVIALRVVDPREESLPAVGLIQLDDAETLERITIDTKDKRFREKFAKLNEAVKERIRSTLKSAKVDAIEIRTGSSYIDPLLKFFRMRAKR
ncbi:MAG: DUF58 domain-containing protein, partial [Candidatus Omnitrophica bacterium]|nr:DUF58 domain-containing protein [Candidatus Omnitrophota bacterium]